jgi:hypothetical protein
MSLMRVMGDGTLAFECPICDKTLEVGLHVVQVAADPTTKVSPLTSTHYGHRVQFIAEAPNLHAEFWGHLVREHQPLPHPYLSPERVVEMVTEKGDQLAAEVAADDGLSMWEQEYERIQQEGQ